MGDNQNNRSTVHGCFARLAILVTLVVAEVLALLATIAIILLFPGLQGKTLEQAAVLLALLALFVITWWQVVLKRLR